MGNLDSYDWCALPHNRFNNSDAHAVAHHFAKLPGVAYVELYGSIAREGVGNDIDMVIVVNDENTYRDFVAEVMSRVHRAETNKGYSQAQYRAEAVERIFGEHLGIVRTLMHDTRDQTAKNVYLYLDMFIAPRDWRERLDELQEHLPHDDPYFMHNIARDAWIIARGVDK